MLTEVQKKNYVPTENLMPSEQIDAHTKPGYFALKTNADGKMYVRDVVMPCPRCGVKSSLRSWDTRRSLMIYHCEGCGNDLALTWTEHVIMKLTGKLRWSSKGVLSVPEEYKNLTPPEDPNSTTWNDVETLKTLVTTAPSQTPTTPPSSESSSTPGSTTTTEDDHDGE